MGAQDTLPHCSNNLGSCAQLSFLYLHGSIEAVGFEGARRLTVMDGRDVAPQARLVPPPGASSPPPGHGTLRLRRSSHVA